jgi:8-oxo-dGTP pyrophosphatase MutT (NUDIX family)
VTEPSGSPASPLPSSTVLVLRDAPDGASPFQVLMVKRHGSVTFPGVHAFPGGVVDPGDERAPGAALPADQRWAEGGGGDTEATALPYWVAAVRELFEEVGILLAMRGGRLLEGPLPRELAAARERLHGGESFAALLERAGVVPGTHLLYASRAG